jgi:hypothetical protein
VEVNSVAARQASAGAPKFLFHRINSAKSIKNMTVVFVRNVSINIQNKSYIFVGKEFKNDRIQRKIY